MARLVVRTNDLKPSSGSGVRGNDLAAARRQRTLPGSAVALPAAVLHVGRFAFFG
jgi:hypothetical protein